MPIYKKLQNKGNECLTEEYDCAAKRSDSYHIYFAPCRDYSGYKSKDSGNRYLRSGKDSGERHDCKRHIGYVIQERTYKAVFDFSPDQGKRKYTDQKRNGCCC